MCALFGWIDNKGIVPHKTLKKLTQALANAAEERGTDAAGISYIKNGKITIYKRPKPAHKLRFSIPDGTKAVMGHTRMTTQGNEKFNYNNHPFLGKADKSFAFAHNGVLWNDSELRNEKKLPPTHIETDSYVAVQLIESQGKLDFDSLKYMAETVEGNYTFTVLDEDNALYIVKGNNPMYLIQFEALGLYIYASTENIMKKALKKVFLDKCSYQRIDTVDGEILRIDCNEAVARSGFEMRQSSHLSGWYDNSEYDSMYEGLLLAYCGLYGVDPEDVALLLDYGYSCDEIEEMLMDTDLLREAIQFVRPGDGACLYEECYDGVF